jgi:phosphatidylinositol alpha-mannosyltransferase
MNKPKEKLRIGMVCPYGWDTPGGVQTHIKQLAEHLIADGYRVSVLAPVSDEDKLVEEWVVPAGRPIPIPVNGSVAKVLFGPIAASRVRQWISDGDFNLLHLHEPAIPSLSLLACWAANGPIVGTFHASSKKRKAIYAIGPMLDPAVEKLSARIAVSELARTTLKDHFDTDAVVIPNGIERDQFQSAKPSDEWAKPNTIGFMGRFNEKRKGLEILLDAMPIIARFVPDINILVAGPGDIDDASKKIDPSLRSRVKFLGRISEEEKASFLKSISVYVAPNTGGESFGIILTECLSAGTPIVASDIPAFAAVLENGKLGKLFQSEDATDLAKTVIELLRDESARKLLSNIGLETSEKYDWNQVASQIESVYEISAANQPKVTVGNEKND